VSILIDTNVLLRRTQPDHEHHIAAVESVARLLAEDEPVYFTLAKYRRVLAHRAKAPLCALEKSA
jgi:predicted nucleic acid-binding protein